MLSFFVHGAETEVSKSVGIHCITLKWYGVLYFHNILRNSSTQEVLNVRNILDEYS